MGFDITRRKLIGGIGLLVAAPAIVRASSLMPVKTMSLYESLAIADGRSALLPPLSKDIWLVSWGESTITTMRGPAMIQALGLEGYCSPTAAGESAA